MTWLVIAVVIACTVTQGMWTFLIGVKVCDHVTDTARRAGRGEWSQ